MRQLTVAFLSFIFSIQAFAFNDTTTVDRINLLKQRLETDALEHRLEHLGIFKDFLYQRLNSDDLMPEDALSLSDNDPRIEEYRSLTEFSGYLNLIGPARVVRRNSPKFDSAKSLEALKTTCRSARQDIVNAVNTQGAEASEAVEALKIVNSLCK